MKISALVCAHDEAAQLGACLASLSGFDQIVVVADRCTDATPEIARRAGAVVVEGAFDLESQRKQAGFAACDGEWVLEIDADERVSPELTAEIRAAVAEAKGDWFKVPIDNYVGDTVVRHGWGGSFGSTLGARLARCGVKQWKDERVHPAVKFDGVSAGVLTCAIQHYVDEDLSDMVQRLNRYTLLRGLDLADRGEPGELWDNVFRGFRRFWKCYFDRKGRLDGDLGFAISLMAGLYPLLSHLKAKEILRQRAKGQVAVTASAAQ